MISTATSSDPSASRNLLCLKGCMHALHWSQWDLSNSSIRSVGSKKAEASPAESPPPLRPLSATKTWDFTQPRLHCIIACRARDVSVKAASDVARPATQSSRLNNSTKSAEPPALPAQSKPATSERRPSSDRNVTFQVLMQSYE